VSAGFVDLYGVLGVARSATVAELRRAYRRLALAHHPDRAGAASGARFAQIADAYRLLSNPLARAAYDETLAARGAWGRRQPDGAVHAGGVDWVVGTNGWQVSRAAPVADVLERLSGRLDELVAKGVARRQPDGSIDLMLNAAEARAGGNAVVHLSIDVVCASCGGVARPRGVWCRICDYRGRVDEDVILVIPIEKSVRSGARLEVPVGRAQRSPLWVRLEVEG
jgi:molecular chaperone DnaJ